MQRLVELLTNFIVAQGALGVFVASALEEIIVPIPSTIVQTGAGFLLLEHTAVTASAIGKLIFIVALPAAAGATLGSLLLYGIVYWGGAAGVRRFGKYFFITPEKIERAKAAIMKHPSLLVGFTVLRFIPVIPNSLLTAVAGFVRLPLWTFMVTTFIGIFVRALILGCIGWVAASTLRIAVGTPASFPIIIPLATLFIIAGIGALLYVRRKKKNR